MIHYELFFFYLCGFHPKDVIRLFGYSRGTAYRFYRIYRTARKRASDIIQTKNFVSPRREKKLKHRDAWAINRWCLILRYNVTNFPKLWGDEIEYKALIEWLVGFERELREWKKHINDIEGCKQCRLIREVLGEWSVLTAKTTSWIRKWFHVVNGMKEPNYQKNS